MSNEILDNMNGQEIKELIDDKKVLIDELDASALRKLMDYETDMLCFGSGDVELIARCSDRLDSIRENGITDEIFFNAVNKAKADYASEASSGDTRQNEIPRTKRPLLRRIGLVAAAIVLVLTTSTLATAAFDFDISRYLKMVMRQGEGAEINVDGMSFYNVGTPTVYSSLEELKEAENFDVAYPTEWPDGVEITEIRVVRCYRGDKNIMIFTNNECVGVDIETAVSIDPEALPKDENFAENEIIKTGDMTFYIVYRRGCWFAVCCHGGNAYSMQADSYENMVLIIKSFKE